MPSLPRYNQINNAIQQDGVNGCIPWAIEWSVRYKNYITGQWRIPHGSLNTFQQDYNLFVKTHGAFQNTFDTILKEIRKYHSNTRLYHYRSFQAGDGARKLNFLENQISKENPCIMPLKYSQTSTHIMPIVEIDDLNVKLIWEIQQNGNQVIYQVPKNHLIHIHDSNLSGKTFVVLR